MKPTNARASIPSPTRPTSLTCLNPKTGLRPGTTQIRLQINCAMNVIAQGVDVSVIALWLGHQNTHSTDAYLHADMTIKQAAIDRTRPANSEPGTYHPEPDILAWLTTL